MKHYSATRRVLRTGEVIISMIVIIAALVASTRCI